MKNIEILLVLKEQVETVGFMMDDLDTRLSAETVELHTLIKNDDGAVVAIAEKIADISYTLNMLTEDLRGSLCNEGFDCEAYATWLGGLKYDLMRLTGLLESFEEAHKVLELYINETIRGYRILTQDGYGTQE